MSKEPDIFPVILIIGLLLFNNLDIMPGSSYNPEYWNTLRAESVVDFEEEYEEYVNEKNVYFPTPEDEEVQTQTQAPQETVKKKSMRSTNLDTTNTDNQPFGDNKTTGEKVVETEVVAERGNRLVLLTGYDFKTGVGWCGPCVNVDNRLLKPLRDRPQKDWIIDESRNAHIQVLYVDQNGFGSEEALKYNVTFFPTLIQLKDGKEVARYRDDKNFPLSNRLSNISVNDIPKLMTGEK